MANMPRRFRVHFSHAPAWNMRARQNEVLVVAAESTQAAKDIIRTAYNNVLISMIEDFPADERMVPPEQRWRVGLTQSGSVPATHKNVEVTATTRPAAITAAVTSNLGWHFNGFAEQLDEEPTSRPGMWAEAWKPRVQEGEESEPAKPSEGLIFRQTGYTPGGQKPEESEPAKPSEECGQAELSEEGKAHVLQYKADQSDLIEWILNYRNPADDATKLRQIRVVMD